MRILGLVGATHDSGIAILNDGDIELVVEEERLIREKRTKRFPYHALVTALGNDAAGLADIDYVVTPWDARRLRRSFSRAVFGNLPGSLRLIAEASHTPQRNEIAILNFYLRRRLKRRFPLIDPPKIINVGHHESHAALFFVSPFERAAVLVMDGYGDDAATSVFIGEGNRLQRRWSSSFFNSLGMVYTFVTGYLGFERVADEGKVMALAAYGDERYVDAFSDCVRLGPGGRYAINMDYFAFDTYGELKPFKRKFYQTFGPPRQPGEPIDDRHKAIAFALQHVTEQTILHIVRSIVTNHDIRKLVFTGGVALNCVAASKILSETDIDEIWVPPAASDTGAPLGACFWHYHHTLAQPRRFQLKSVNFGLAYSNEQIETALAAGGYKAEYLEDDALYKAVAEDLANGAVIGWFQDRFEMGPRALGYRSILADPRRKEMRDTINEKIKQREPFRPFAPAILAERVSEYFEINQLDPFMTIAAPVRADKRDVIPAAVHVDGTARIQTVEEEVNPRFHALIKAFAEKTGVPVLLNTSFNRREPIVATPAEALACYDRAELDGVVLENYYVRRSPVAKPALGSDLKQ